MLDNSEQSSSVLDGLRLDRGHVNAYQVSLTLTFHATDPLEAVQLMADHLNATPSFDGMCYQVKCSETPPAGTLAERLMGAYR